MSPKRDSEWTNENKCVYLRVEKMGLCNDDDDGDNHDDDDDDDDDDDAGDICPCSGTTEPQWIFTVILFCLSDKHFSIAHFL